MSVVMKKVAIFLFVLAIGNCAPQKDNVSIAPSDLKQEVKYEVVNTKLASDPQTSIQINNDTTSTVAPTTTTKSPDTTTVPTTSPDTKPTTTTVPTTTVTPPTTPSTTSTTTPIPTTTPVPTPSTTSVPTTTSEPHPLTTTAKPEPVPCRRFDGPSFIGGIVLTIGLIAISFVVWKFYKSRTERNYHTL